MAKTARFCSWPTEGAPRRKRAVCTETRKEQSLKSVCPTTSVPILPSPPRSSPSIPSSLVIPLPKTFCEFSCTLKGKRSRRCAVSLGCTLKGKRSRGGAVSLGCALLGSVSCKFMSCFKGGTEPKTYRMFRICLKGEMEANTQVL